MSETFDDVVILRIKSETKRELINKARASEQSLSSLIRTILDNEADTERQKK